ncbi:gamma-aminobutyric acid receptor subunit alpha-3-like [Tigriopus californicus]|uniref:gamma-aminobutyric acid receptor subunit alpha-3-like n=1 Tax=Tigriopus californicus TaxID=6832 RepID=UPI0027DA36BA|nr:gamma-aminobutyric acid receptor subunit alpha-3-like [Tigriopus californicus]
MGSLVGISHGYLTLGILVFVTRIPIQALDFQDKVSRFGRVLLSNGNDSQTMAQYATQATPAAKSRNNEAPSSVRKIPYAPTKPRNYNQTADNVTFLLDNLLKDYDNSLRPNIGGEPLMVEINMQVRSMGPISEVDMSYSMDCYFRQSWVDRRLAFSGRKNLALSIEMLRKIWKPDTYIYNGRKSYLHTITTPNKFMRLFPNGRVLYSQRLTIKASCQMDLSDFPMDKQKCPLQIGSFGYTINDVIYQWTAGRGVNIASDMKLSQFDLISTPTGNSTTFLNKGRHSTLVVGFHLQRHMGNFVIQVYGPCVLLVVISWVSFWLNREATSDRISLGVTTVLTMTFLGLEARTDLPQVAYATALDYFVFVSFMSIFATVTQFAVVHYFTKVGSGEYYLEELEETFCALEMKRKLILEQGLFGMF